MVKVLNFTKNSERKKNRTHLVLTGITTLLILIGFLTILSCAPDYKNLFKDPSYYKYMSHIVKQFGFILAGFGIFIIAALGIDYKKYQKFRLYIYTITTILLFIPFFCKAHNGAHRWIELPLGFTVQPSELAKITFVIMIADYLTRKQKYINFFKYNIIPLFYFALFAVIILFQKDLGTVVLLASVLLSMFFIAGIDLKKIFAVIGTFAVSASALIFLFPYRLQRIIDYKNSLFDMSQASHNVKMALVAFGSGGIFGKGPGESEMKLDHLPERNTDFILPIIGEEYGFIGTCLVIILFIWLMNTGFSISKNCPDKFGKYLAFAITCVITFQVLINMAMAVNLIPAKGLPLPFISYGGSSMVVSCLMIGILFNISESSNKTNEN